MSQTPPDQTLVVSFGEVLKLIEAARQKSFQAVNTALINL
jgi:hypothetical protein